LFFNKQNFTNLSNKSINKPNNMESRFKTNILGEKWVLRLGERSSWKFWPIVFLALGILLIFQGLSYNSEPGKFSGIFFIVFSIWCYERYHFYQIIVKQQKIIDKMSSENTK